MMIADLDAWRRVCLEAYRNLPTDTEMTMGQVDAVLSVGAREAAVLDTSTAEGSADYERLLDRVGQSTGVEREDVDAVLTWRARDAAALLPEEDQPSPSEEQQ
jgi:hypothetical protein